MTRDTIVIDTIETVAVDAARTFERLARGAYERGDVDGERTYARCARWCWAEVLARRTAR